MACTALPDSAARWQELFDAIHDDCWSGGDGGHSALLPDGRELLMYGDTFGGPVRADGARTDGALFFPNSMAVASGDQISWINPPGHPAIPPAPDGAVFWPEAIVATDGAVHVLANRVHRRGTAVAGIRVVGQSLVTFDARTLALQSVTTLTTFAERRDGIWWSAGAAVDAGFLYVYGVRLDRLGDYGRSVYVARVRLPAMAWPSGWRYWNGSDWTPEPAPPGAARLICREADTVVSVWRRGSTWHLVTQKYGMLGRDVALWTANAPQGPWHEAEVLYRIPDSPHADVLFYEATAHPEVPLASGKLLLSYSRNGSTGRIHADANWYKPQFVEVPQ